MGIQIDGMVLTYEDGENIFKAAGYSPCAGRRLSTRAYWGAMHHHSVLSIESRLIGDTLGRETKS